MSRLFGKKEREGEGGRGGGGEREGERERERGDDTLHHGLSPMKGRARKICPVYSVFTVGLFSVPFVFS